MSWVLTIAGFAALIVLHEFGHFAVAKAVGMRVERFALFFPPLLFKVRRGETEYGIGAIPLGGYVRISGMNPHEELPPDVQPRAYFRQPPWKRIVVIAAGPAMNILVAFLILWGLYWANGTAQATSTVAKQGLAPPASAVLRPGDRIVAVDGHGGSPQAIHDAFLARLTHSSSAFGVELDSLADVVSFGLAPAILAFQWGLWPAGRLGWAAGFIYLTAVAMRLARFNIQTTTVTDKRYFAGLPSPAAAGVIASTVFLYPWGLQDARAAVLALPLVLVPALLMVTTIRFRSIKAIDVGWRRSYIALFIAAVLIALIASHPRIALVAMSYTYIIWAVTSFAITRFRRRPATP